MNIETIVIEVSKLSLKPGDILVVKSDRRFSVDEYKAIAESLERIRPEGVKIAILDAGLSLQIMEQSSDKAA